MPGRYAPYAAGLFCNSKFGTQWGVIFGAACCGVSAGLLTRHSERISPLTVSALQESFGRPKELSSLRTRSQNVVVVQFRFGLQRITKSKPRCFSPPALV